VVRHDFWHAPRYLIVEPPGNFDDDPLVLVYTRDEILKDYFEYWSAKMRLVGKDELISEQNCIEDWIIVNYAEAVHD
jgi:hypothetical protein